jgi:hypothetical protein
MANLDVQKLADKTVAIEFYGLTPDFAREYFTAWLQAQRVRIASDSRRAQLKLNLRLGSCCGSGPIVSWLTLFYSADYRFRRP